MESRNGKVYWIVALLVLLGCLLSVIFGAVAGGAAGYFLARGGRATLPEPELWRMWRIPFPTPQPVVPTPQPLVPTPQAPQPQPTPRLRIPVPLTGTTGALLSQVIADTPADKAGLRAGDIITAVDNTEVNADNDLATLIGRHKPGDVVTLKVTRGLQEPREVKVTLGEKPGEAGKPYLGVYYSMITPRIQPSD
ncbi:MAG: PDZ domain-containing protein [Chloroflexi bacterium]|nr:PDZ domain-containing protein [Chloroflexota bacterium]